MIRYLSFSDKNYWLFTYLAVGVWQSAGWGTILYLASLTGINRELYEAAEVDGASRLRRIWHISLPGIKTTIVTLLIINVGNMISIGFDRPFIIGNVAVREYSDVLSTFVYRVGLRIWSGCHSTSLSVCSGWLGLSGLLLGANYTSKKLTDESIM